MQIQGDAWVIGGTDPGDLLSKVERLLKDLTPANAAVLPLDADKRLDHLTSDADLRLRMQNPQPRNCPSSVKD